MSHGRILSMASLIELQKLSNAPRGLLRASRLKMTVSLRRNSNFERLESENEYFAGRNSNFC